MQLKNKCEVGSKVFRGYEKEWMERSNGWKKGATITAKAPLHARVKDGETIDVEDIREEDVSMTVDQRKHHAHKLTGTEMSLNIEEFSQRIIQPSVDALVDYMNTDLMGLYKYIPNQVGTPGLGLTCMKRKMSILIHVERHADCQPCWLMAQLQKVTK